MEKMKLAAAERRFAELIWANAPMTTAKLVKEAQAALDWKRTTTYTVLRRLCDRGLFELNDGTVTVKLSREEYESMQSEEFVREAFDGSLPAFVAAFSRRSRLNEVEIAALQKLIDESRR